MTGDATFEARLYRFAFALWGFAIGLLIGATVGWRSK